jgi:hypothetical protein
MKKQDIQKQTNNNKVVILTENQRKSIHIDYDDFFDENAWYNMLIEHDERIAHEKTLYKNNFNIK